MSESTPINVQAFQPFEGGRGKRLTATDTTTSGAIPGTQAVEAATLRILVTNGGLVSVFIRMGQSDVVATLDSLEILAGTQVLLTPPFADPQNLWFAAICDSNATTNVSACAGKGT